MRLLYPFRRPARPNLPRRGAVLVLAALVMVMIFGFLAFAADSGFILLAKTQMQAATDAAAYSAATEFSSGLGSGALSPSAVSANVAAVAKDIAGRHRAADLPSAFLNTSRDVRLGRYEWDATAGAWKTNWNASPYNLIEVGLHRDQGSVTGSNGDRPIPLFFAPVIGYRSSNVTATSRVAVFPGVGFRLDQGSTDTINILPIALDVGSWNKLIAGTGTDKYKYDPASGHVSAGSDGILEINIYPNGTTNLPPGNRGTVDIGSSNNSTNDIKRQILYGLNANDLSYFGGQLRFDSVPLVLNGDTGISAGIKAELAAIIGQVRAIPLFSAVSGPGNNANYTIVKFVGVRILDVNLTGSPSNKQLTVQPAPFVSSHVIPGKVTLTTDSILSTPRMVQ